MADAPQQPSVANLNPGLEQRCKQAMAVIAKLSGNRPSWNIAGTTKAAARQISHDAASELVEPKISNLTDYTCWYSAICDEVTRVMSNDKPESMDTAAIEQHYNEYKEFYATGGNDETQQAIGGMKRNPDETLGLSEVAISELAPEAVKTVTQAAADAAHNASHKHGFNITELLAAQQAQANTSSVGMSAGA